MEDYLGKIVYSRKGRDQGRLMVVVEIINEQYVMVVDGDLRRVENPKLKNVRHLKFTEHMDKELLELLQRSEMPGNHIIKKNLKELIARQRSPGKEV